MQGIEKIAAILFSSMAITFSADRLAPSFDPPGELSVDKVPLFIVLGFDDNRYVDGIEWTLRTLEGKKNPAGAGNPATFDGQDIGASFYFTTNALEEGGSSLLAAWGDIRDRGYEIGNHTMTHETGQSTTLATWRSEISGCRSALVEKLGVNHEDILGFRTPYLAFNEQTFQAVAQEGLLYECTMTQMQDYHKGMFVWPYTLDNGFADKVIEGWVGKCAIPGLWEIPVYTVGADATMWPPITGFDSSVLTQANGGQFEAMLKNAIEYRLKEGGNRAPLTVGLHTDTYAQANPSGVNYDQALNLDARRAALAGFIEYALQKPMVRFVSALQLIQWMRNPVALDDIQIVAAQKDRLSSPMHLPDLRFMQGRIELSNALGTDAEVSVFALDGRLLTHRRIPAGVRFVPLHEPCSTALCMVQLKTALGSQTRTVVSMR